ncbi:methyl-accepting chemotaxis protein [Rhizobium sp. FY34]|uniref:methyl-accepting chemotaxis protein n=1 Tax=Rhizobium sp. FY34 TaxID=2562309 RepID=UPI0010C09887|nr:methyl-accepting chemotaxis protein [Rhizobium sp. FY34]
MKVTIARSLLLFGILVGSGVGTAISIQNYAFDRLRVNGPVYQEVVFGKDLVADILPPPLFLVEAYLLATESAVYPELAGINLSKIADLRKAYAERNAYWESSTLDPVLKNGLKQKVRPTSERFWQVIEGDYAKAVASGNGDAIRAASAVLRAAFQAHQNEVVTLVTSANAFLAAAEKTAAEETNSLTAISYGAAGAALLLLVAGLVALHRRAIRPLSGMRDYMSVLAGGDYSKSVPYDDRQDEIGEMAAAVTVFRSNAQERIANRQRQDEEREAKLLAERQAASERAAEDAARARVLENLSRGLERLATGDLTARLSEPFTQSYEKLRQEFNGSIQSLEETLSQIIQAMQAVKSGAASIADGTDNLSRRTETQAASLEEAASALNQITTTVKTTTDRAREANTRMVETKSSTEQSTEIVRQAVTAMSKIEESSTQIRQIISVIDEIAFQTNLLALNAGVEAARAGEAGKGFAVVAQEVRELAGRSANASREIRQLIDASTSQVGTGVALVNRTGEALGTIEQQIQSVNSLISAIVSSSSEQSFALSEVSEAVNRMDQVTQQNASMAEEANAACRDLNAHTDALNHQLARFRLGSAGRRQERVRMAS